MRQSIPFLIISPMLALACGQAGPAHELPFGRLEQPIIDGALSDASEEGIVYIETTLGPNNGTSCTGTLVAPNLVLTALHCVTFYNDGSFSCNADGSITSSSPLDGTIGQTVPPANIEIHLGLALTVEPEAFGARVLGTGSNQICRNDLALVVLDRNLDAPYARLRLSGGVGWGDLVRVVGYGQREISANVERYGRSGVRVVDVGPLTDGGEVRTAAPRTFVLNEGPCHGDSGGPAFDETTGAMVGVYSITAGAGCSGVGIRNVYTSLAPFSELILDAFTEVGAEPLLEDDGEADVSPPEPDPGGCSLMCKWCGSAFEHGALGAVHGHRARAGPAPASHPPLIRRHTKRRCAAWCYWGTYSGSIASAQSRWIAARPSGLGWGSIVELLGMSLKPSVQVGSRQQAMLVSQLLEHRVVRLDAAALAVR